MPQIQILDIATSNRIAAGEVVERPASIVKELIENSLDAGASAVSVEVREGGIDYLRVTDNGAGFPPEEVRIAFERHATSKLRSGDALDNIATLGFRGEALPSIAAVSRVELTTRRAGQESGVRLAIEGGSVKDLREAGCPEGTTMVVRDLFYNTPARKAFLKRASTEGGYVGDAVLQLSLARPDVSFRMILNGRTIFHTPGDNDLLKTITVLFGRDIASDLVPIQGTWDHSGLEGFVGLQDAARANRQREYFIVNGRFVRSPLLALAVEEAVRGGVAIGKYPFCVLTLRVPLDAVDVNVHPNKLEVRFRDEGQVRSNVISVVSQCLKPADVAVRVPLFPPEAEKPLQKDIQRVAMDWKTGGDPFRGMMATPRTTAAAEPGAMALPGALLPPRSAPAYNAQPPRAAVLPPGPHAPREIDVEIQEVAVRKIETAPQAEPVPMAIAQESRSLGTLFATYLLVESGDILYLIDQHAAHERLLYDQLKESLATGAGAQALLIPYAFDVTPRERARVIENLDHFSALGFRIEEFGPTSFRVETVPHILGDPQLRDFFIEFLDQLDSISSMRTADLKRDAIARIACHKAVKAGDRLSAQEIDALLGRVMQEDMPLTCPHGRPILLRMTRAEIEKRFRRTQ